MRDRPSELPSVLTPQAEVGDGVAELDGGPIPIEPTAVYKAPEAARVLRISRSLLERLVERGRLRPIYLGDGNRARVFLGKDLIALVEHRRPA